jgi:hypothetical protein
MPCTKVMTALATNRPFLKLQGTTDEAVTIDDRTVIVVADPGAVLTRGNAGNILTIEGASNVQIHDLAIVGASGNGAGISLSPAGTQLVTLNHVSMSGNRGTGGAVATFGGTINIYRSTISDNTGGGVSVSMTAFDIENNFITNNGSPQSSYGGISVERATAGSRILSFNTISTNRGGMDVSTGVSCSLVMQDVTFSNNIVYGNIVAGGGTQVGGTHCLWTYSDIGPGGSTISGSGNLNVDPMFTPNGTFHLQAGSQVIDRADPDATANIDFDGDPRPQGTRRDIGADEYKAMAPMSQTATMHGRGSSASAFATPEAQSRAVSAPSAR